MNSTRLRLSFWSTRHPLAILGYALPVLLGMVVGCQGTSTPTEAVRDSMRDNPPPDESVHIQFQHRNLSLSAPFRYENDEIADRSTILDGMGGGAAVLDFDRDGLLDVLFAGGGQFGPGNTLSGKPPGLFRQMGAWQFQLITEPACVDAPRRYTHAAVIGDYDNDGFEDILMTGYGGMQLYQNQGDGTFLDRTNGSELGDRLWSTSGAWGDVDGDGHLDLYVTHYVDWSFENDPRCPTVDGRRRERCPPQRFGPLPDSLYLSCGDGTFRDVSTAWGLRRDGKGLGVVMADLDLDGDLDIYVANDTVGNFLYRNSSGSHFDEIAVAAGCAFNEAGAPDGSMGVTVMDYNLDGLPDLWVVNYERETIGLYQNLGNLTFEHVSQKTGVSVVGTMYVGFGTVFLDADLDGDEDAFVANGHVLRFPNNAPVRQRPLIFDNLAGKRFREVSAQSGDYGRNSHVGRGVAHGDLDGDGDLDLAVSHLQEPACLLENLSARQGAWLAVKLVGTSSNRDAVGTRLTLVTTRSQQSRQVSSGDSYLSHSDRRVHFGIPEAEETVQLTIDWPDGRRQTVSRPPSNQVLTLRQPLNDSAQ